jgi:adenylate cyclase
MKKWRSIFVLCIGVGAALLLSIHPWADSLNLHVYDFLLANTTVSSTSDDVVVIGIDDQSLQRFDEPLVLWHKYLAQVINGAADSNAKGIALDIIPTISLDKLAPELDQQLIYSIRHANNSGTPVYLGFRTGENKIMPHRKFLLSAGGLGFLNFYPDKDGKIRKQTALLISKDNYAIHSLSAVMTEIRAPLSSGELPHQIYIDYRLAMPKVYEFGRVYDWAKDGKIDKLKAAFGNKMVFIGVTSPLLPDIYTVPVKLGAARKDRVPGVLIHAFTAKTLIAGQMMQDVPLILVWCLAVAVSFFSGMLFFSLPPWKAGGIAAVLFILITGGIIYAFTLFWIIPAAPFIFSLLIPSAVTGTYQYTKEYRQFRHLQRFFKSYVNPQVMKEIIDNPELVSFDGQQVIVTVMFTDIRNFTALSEKTDPRVLVAGLNRYFKEMTAAITEVNGYLNRYLGDGILVIFGAPNKLPDDGAWAAVCCACNILERLEELNKSEIFPGVSDKVHIGIGIHTGEAVVGNIGCYEKMDYSIVGDTPNLASRIEEMTKEFKIPLLVSEATYNYVKDRVQAKFVGSVKVRGRVQEVNIYEITSVSKEV